MLFKGHTPLTKDILQDKGPDNFQRQATAKDPLSLVILDGCGPSYFKIEENKFETVLVLTCVILKTYRTNLIPLRSAES